MKHNATLLFLIAAVFFHTNAKAYSQGITLKVSDASLDKVFTLIQKQTKFVFVYSAKQLAGTKRVSVDVKDEKLEKVLQMILEGQPLRYEVDKEYVIIKVKMPALVESKEGKPGELTGKVTNEKGEPVVGATISVEGSEIVTATDSEGSFTIKNVEGNIKIKITSVGYEPRIISLKADTRQLLVKLFVTAQEMKEVIVSTGFQQLPKERATGSFVQIDNELFNRKVSNNVLDRIYDITSSLSYTHSTGGTVSDGLPPLQIRGASTINADKAPLIVVDNFPFEGDLNSVNPNDVETITILRDASAASIWGVRSGNGVIVITTKKGKFNQKTNVSFNSNVTVVNKPDLFYIPSIPSKDIVEFEMKRFSDSIYNIYDDFFPRFKLFPKLNTAIEILLAARKGKLDHSEADRQLELLKNHDVRDDLSKYFLQKSIKQQYSLNINGGSESYRYYASVGYDENRSELVGNKDNRFSLRMNSAWRPIKSLEVNGEINYTIGQGNGTSTNYGEFLPTGKGIPSYSRLADNNGTALAIPAFLRSAYVDTAYYPALLDWHYKPLDEMKHNTLKSRQNSIRISTGLKYSLFNGLSISFNYQLQKSFADVVNKNSEKSFAVRNMVNQFMNIEGGALVYPYPIGSRIINSNSELTAWNTRLMINYEKIWGFHKVSIVAGADVSESKTDRSSSEIIGYNENLGTSPVVDFQKIYPIRPNGNSAIGGGLSSYSTNDNLFRNGSYFGNIGYNYKERYLMTFSSRIDQANLFGVDANMRKVPLWSSGIGWILSNESFFNLTWINNLKIRATYGFNGNIGKNVSGYPTIIYIPNSTTIPTGADYAQIQSPLNKDLRWEKVKMINWGLDFSLIEGKISGSLEYYTKKGIDLIGSINSDPTTGWATYIGNYASIKAHGIDIILNTQLPIKNFSWNSTFLLSYNSDKVTKYGGQDKLNATTLVEAFPIQEGKTIFALNSYKWAGLDPITGEPRILLADTISNFSNYSKATASDIEFKGSRSPRVFGAFLNTFSWSNLSLSCNITYKLNYVFRRSTFNYSTLLNSSGGHVDYVSRWKKTGDEKHTSIPSLPNVGTDDRYVIYSLSSELVERGDHIRLQDLRLSYKFSKKKIQWLPFQNSELYLFVNNIGIIWRLNNKNIDPEFFDFGTIPSPRTYSIGLTFSY